MKAQTKAQTACDVKVAADGKSLRLSFPRRHSPLWEALDGKSLKGKPKYLYLTKHGFNADEPDDWKRASQIAIAMEADLDHPEWEKLFDPTLAKYGLGGGKYAKLADVLQMPGTVQVEPEITVGEMWEAYLEWKEGQIQESTFHQRYRTFTNALEGKIWDAKLGKFFDSKIGVCNLRLDSPDLIEKVLETKLSPENKKGYLGALNEAFLYVQAKGKVKLAVNPFHELWKQNKPDTRDAYKPTIANDGSPIEWWQAADAKGKDSPESDKRAFTKDERDIIIKAFYESDKENERQAAPLIEFLFLTGCRQGEAYALRWQDVMFERGIIRFSKSYSSEIKKVKKTKTGEIRMFGMYPRLNDLLRKIKPENVEKTDLVFKILQGRPFNSSTHRTIWLSNNGGTKYACLGVVARLAEEGKISQYLPPYHTRHTYITLTAWANRHNTSALDLLATACGNSVDVIVKHYLGVDENAKVIHV